MTHPLTDEKAMSLFSFERLMDASQPITVEDSMRTAADWQLEQVIKFLSNNLDERYIDDGDALAPGIDVESVIDDLKQAMRPTTTQEDNS